MSLCIFLKVVQGLLRRATSSSGASLRGVISCALSAAVKVNSITFNTSEQKVLGGAERDRTAGLLVANEALSQLSYSPTDITRALVHTCC
jgi:hypothetical protein